NVDAYEYNYWCSPVGSKANSSINNAFGISLLNDITDSFSSIPATFNASSSYNGTASPLNIEPNWIWKFIASNDYSQWIYIGGNTTINPGEGFTMKGTNGTSANNLGGNQNYDFRGKPNNGTIAVDILENQFSLVGNPYPSALDALAYIHDTDNASIITGTLFYWEQDKTVNSHNLSAYDGGYATYTISSDGSVETYVPAVFYTYNGDGTINVLGNGMPSGYIPQRYIPIGQGFMVEGDADGQVLVKNAHRVYYKESDAESTFFRNAMASNSVFENTMVDSYSRLRFNITFDDSYTRQIVQTFSTFATENFDYGLEIRNTIPLQKDALFSDSEYDYVAQANQFDIDMLIPLKFNHDAETQVSINLVDTYNFDETIPVFLYDLLDQTYTNLLETVPEIDLNPEQSQDRYYIVFQNQDTLDFEEIENTQMFLRYYNSAEELMITNPLKYKMKTLIIYDMSGREVQRYTINANDSSYGKKINHLPNGGYIAQCIYGNNLKQGLKFVK
ncbi:MAG: hypothetical protein AAF688_15345, partial [Bacteroidota bacterium]